MKVFGVIRQDTGVGAYRIGQPVQFINNVEKEQSRITPFTGQNVPVRISEGLNRPTWTDEMLMESSKDADIIFSNVLTSQDEILKMLDLRKWSGAKWVVDIDDNIYAVTSDNPASKNTQAFYRNFELCLSLADGVTVSVPYLKEIYRNLNKNIFVNPNGIDFSIWKPQKRRHKGLRVGWRGAYGHRGDILSAQPALEKVYDIDLVSFGVKPPFKTEHHEWVPFLKYADHLASLELDVAVVPLVDNAYNKGKSNLAILEYSALKIPVIASPTENQKDMPILYAKTNYEWFEALKKMKDKDFRKEQAKKQYDFVRKNYDMKVLTPPLIDFFKNLERKKL